MNQDAKTLDANALAAAKAKVWEHEQSDIEDIAEEAIRAHLSAIRDGEATEGGDRLPSGHIVLEQADMLDGRVSQTVTRPNGTEYERIVDASEAYGDEE